MKRTSLIAAMAVTVMLTIFACVSNQPPSAPAPKAGKPLAKSLPARVQGVELVGGTVRVKSGFQWVKQPNGTVTVARIAGGSGLQGSWVCKCSTGGTCRLQITGRFLVCLPAGCSGACDLIVTTTGLTTPVIAY
jgi:hypothetical protein